MRLYCLNYCTFPVIQEAASTLLTATTNFLRTHGQDRDVVEEIGGNILRGISNILNASAVVTEQHYRNLTGQEERGEFRLTQRMRRMSRGTNNIERDFVKVGLFPKLSIVLKM